MSGWEAFMGSKSTIFDFKIGWDSERLAEHRHLLT
jgi:hypothetical protein